MGESFVLLEVAMEEFVKSVEYVFLTAEKLLLLQKVRNVLSFAKHSIGELLF